MRYEKIQISQNPPKFPLLQEITKQRITITIVIIFIIVIVISLAFQLNNLTQNNQQYLSSSNQTSKNNTQYSQNLFKIKVKNQKKSTKSTIQSEQKPNHYQKLSINQRKEQKTPPRPTSSRSGVTPQHLAQWIKFSQLKALPLTSPQATQQKQYYEQKYHISKYNQLPFCIVIPSYNNVNQNRYLNNINSILQQQYQNYHIVFIDDKSSDGTGIKMVQFANKHKISNSKLHIIINSQRKMAMFNIYTAASQFCKPYQLLMIVDGDDQLLGKQVFHFFNAIIQQKNLFLAYTNFIMNNKIGFSRPYLPAVIKYKKFRIVPFVISHLRVFYTKLLYLIDKKDFLNQNGTWINSANDVAIYLPIMQMVGSKMLYIPQLTYIYNSNTGFNNFAIRKSSQKENQLFISSKSSYHTVYQLFNDQEIRQLSKYINNKIPIKQSQSPLIEGVEKCGWEL